MRGRCLLLPVSTGLPHKQHGPLWLQAGARHDPNIRMKMMIPGFRHGEYRPHNVRRAHLPPDRCRLNLRSDIGAESGGIANPCRQFLVIHQYSLLGEVPGNVLRTTWMAPASTFPKAAHQQALFASFAQDTVASPNCVISNCIIGIFVIDQASRKILVNEPPF